MRKHTAEELRRRAQEILDDAQACRETESRATLVRLAASYAQMAQQMEEIAAPRTGRWDMQPAQMAQSQDKR